MAATTPWAARLGAVNQHLAVSQPRFHWVGEMSDIDQIASEEEWREVTRERASAMLLSQQSAGQQPGPLPPARLAHPAGSALQCPWRRCVSLL